MSGSYFGAAGWTSERNRERGKHPKKAGPMLTRSKVEVTSIMDLLLPSWNTLRSESSNKIFRSFFKVHVRGWHGEMSRLCCSPVARLNPVTASPVVWRGRARGVGGGGEWWKRVWQRRNRQTGNIHMRTTDCVWPRVLDIHSGQLIQSSVTFLQQDKCWFLCFV